jgi:hypothetical protein
MPLISLALAALTSAFVWGSPTYKLVWKVEGKPVLDSWNAQLVKSPETDTWEMRAEVELFTECRSLWAERRLRAQVAGGAVLLLQVFPVDAVELRQDRLARGGANCRKLDDPIGEENRLITRRYLELPITNPEKSKKVEEVSQAKLPFTVVVADPDASDVITFTPTLEFMKKGKLRQRRIVAVGDSQRIKLEGNNGGPL